MRIVTQLTGQAPPPQQQQQHGVPLDSTMLPTAYLSQYANDGLDGRFIDSEMADMNSIDFLDLVNQAAGYSPGTDEDGYLPDLNTPEDMKYPMLFYDMQNTAYAVDPTQNTLDKHATTAVAPSMSETRPRSEQEVGDILKEASTEIEKDSSKIGTDGIPKVTLTLKPRESWAAPETSSTETDSPQANIPEEKTAQRSTSKVKTRRRGSDETRFEQLSLPPPKQRKEVDVESITERNKRNAIQARVNRQRKKEHMEIMQEEMDTLQKQNAELRSTNVSLERRVNDMTTELHYLRNVLANQSSLSKLLQNIGSTNGVRLRTSVATATPENGKVGGGVCLHVDKDDISVEFCAQCSKMAKEGAT